MTEGSGQRTVAYVLLGVGVVGLGAGTIFGLMASSRWNSSQKECSVASCPDHDSAVSDKNSATSSALVSTVSFIAGGAALTAGAVLYFTAPSRSSSGAAVELSPTALPGGGGVRFRGAF